MSSSQGDVKRPISLRVWRQQHRHATGHWQEYAVTAGPYDRVLDLLNYVKNSLDGSLTYRKSCGHSVCGSCAMRINGSNMLACKALVAKLKSPINVAPLPGLPVMRDLVVDMQEIFAAHSKVQPYLENTTNPPQKERIQQPDELQRYLGSSRCILCAACTTACPLYNKGEAYFGPAALVQAHRFVFDNRDMLKTERLLGINSRAGVWRCRTAFRCTAVCPQKIDVTMAIQELKQELSILRPDRR